MVRIIAGSARGHKIKTVPSPDTRPTLDRVKEPMFSILTPDIPGRTVLDLFAGNGALGIEALSRGAAGAYFTDCDRTCAAVIRENLVSTGFADRGHVMQADYREALSRYAREEKRFTLILLDPPYALCAWEDALTRISRLSLWEPGCVAMCEHDRETALPDRIGAFVREKERHYGSVGLTFYRAGELV